GARIEAQLVEDAADVAGHRALGYEESRPDLLIGQALGDQQGDLRFPLSENRVTGLTRTCAGHPPGFAKCQPDRIVSAQSRSRLNSASNLAAPSVMVALSPA